ncbi:hypothetical protein CaCOL14_001993 [Colletotrichum acutatum]
MRLRILVHRNQPCSRRSRQPTRRSLCCAFQDSRRDQPLSMDL